MLIYSPYLLLVTYFTAEEKLSKQSVKHIKYLKLATADFCDQSGKSAQNIGL